ncbi:hypothetical protein Tco_1522338 [Tanacetum coccineum]
MSGLAVEDDSVPSSARELVNRLSTFWNTCNRYGHTRDSRQDGRYDRPLAGNNNNTKEDGEEEITNKE